MKFYFGHCSVTVTPIQIRTLAGSRDPEEINSTEQTAIQSPVATYEHETILAKRRSSVARNAPNDRFVRGLLIRRQDKIICEKSNYVFPMVKRKVSPFCFLTL